MHEQMLENVCLFRDAGFPLPTLGIECIHSHRFEEMKMVFFDVDVDLISTHTHRERETERQREEERVP